MWVFYPCWEYQSFVPELGWGYILTIDYLVAVGFNVKWEEYRTAFTIIRRNVSTYQFPIQGSRAVKLRIKIRRLLTFSSTWKYMQLHSHHIHPFMHTYFIYQKSKHCFYKFLINSLPVEAEHHFSVISVSFAYTVLFMCTIIDDVWLQWNRRWSIIDSVLPIQVSIPPSPPGVNEAGTIF